MPTKLIRVIPAMLLAAVFLGEAYAQSYPSRPIRLVVPFAPGGGNDVVSRAVAERVGSALGQQVVVDNRPGAGGTIALDAVARGNADGYTLVSAGPGIAVLPYLYRNVSFDPVKSFAPIILMSSQPYVLAVHASVPTPSFKDFVALARAKPNTLTFATPGTGTLQHLSGELIKKLGGIDIIHVPYKGGGPAIVDLIGGQVSAAVLGSSVVIPHARAGKVRILAVTTRVRSAALPNVPTLWESGLSGIDVDQSLSLLAPARTPREIIARLNAEATKALTHPAVRERLEAAGFEPRAGSPKDVEVLLRDGQARWSTLIKELGLKPE